jgi:hypothetical protein
MWPWVCLSVAGQSLAKLVEGLNWIWWHEPQIGQSKRRPSMDDVQLAFINANASTSPLTKLVSTLRGGGGKKK